MISKKKLSGRGLGLLSEGDYKGAIELFNQALELDPKFAEAYSFRAQAHYKIKNYHTRRKPLIAMRI